MGRLRELKYWCPAVSGDGGSFLGFCIRSGGSRLKLSRQKLMAVDACLERVLGGNRGSGGNSV